MEEFAKALLESQKLMQEKMPEQQQIIVQLLQRQQPGVGGEQQLNLPGDSSSRRIKDLTDSMLPFEYNPDENAVFEQYYARYKSIFEVENNDLTDTAKIRLLLKKFSTPDFQRYADSILPKKTHEISFADTIKSLKKLFGHRQTKFSLRHKVFSLHKEDNEDYSQYAARINKHAEKFDITSCTADDFKVLLFVSGLKSPRVTRSLLTKVEHQYVQFEALTDQAQIAAFVKLQLDDLDECYRMRSLEKDKETVVVSSSGSEVHAVRQGYNKQKQFPNKSSSQLNPQSSSSFHSNQGPWKAVSQQEFVSVSDINSVDIQRKFIEPDVNGKKLKLQFDTASDITIISKSNWAHLGRPTLQPVTKATKSASGDSVPFLGLFPCVVKFKGREEFTECYVSSLQVDGSNDLTAEVIKKFPILFSAGLGRCNTTKASLVLKEQVKPKFCKPRTVPFAAQNQVATELQRLQHLKILTPCKYSEWAAPIVVVKKKNGKLHICADYSTGLNDSLEFDKHPLLTPDKIFMHLASKQTSSKIDLSDAFWQSTDFSRALKQLQQFSSDTTLSGTNTFGFINDMITAGIDEIDHKRQLFETLQRLQDAGFRLQAEKCEFGKSSVEFCGHIVDNKGIRPHPDKLQQIQDLPRPQDVSQLRSFIGAVNYYGKFIKSMKELRGPLDNLLCKDTKFEWKEEHENAFIELKRILASDLVLTHYDPKKKLVLASDASAYGTGATLMRFHDGNLHPIMCWSGTFNKLKRATRKSTRKRERSSSLSRRLTCTSQTDISPLRSITSRYCESSDQNKASQLTQQLDSSDLPLSLKPTISTFITWTLTASDTPMSSRDSYQIKTNQTKT
ncbi:PREDICTED: uncharacterized protein K02A2.6-like [Vollenhovia emeryi]|uniref:uncharacterized protein K02A2.6-like n=1 Tax=Vollenhovia emeryi TaxID=411798 RepID=UPI0005F4C698|nr:PREDICTED: uncharacterized protein K02A2.6-like [Vollenhovia emeryi]